MNGLFLAAGSSDYAHGELCELGGVRGDLERLRRLFTRSLGYAAPPALLNESAGTLRGALGGDPEVCFDGDDTVVVYYTGHGAGTNGRHYLLCADSDPDRPAATALGTDDLVRLMHERGARRLLLVIDTCYAAVGAAESISEAAHSVALDLGQRPQVYVDRRLKAFSVISAARDYERAGDSRFSEALVQAVSSEACGGARARQLMLEDIVDHINRALGTSGASQHATHATLLSDPGGHPFFPNPRYTHDTPPEGVSLAEQRALLKSRDGAASGARPASPQPLTPDELVGRDEALARLETWCAAPAPPRRWLAVTGSPGSGKSALLRALSRRLARSTDARTEVSASYLSVNMRHRWLEDLTREIAVSEGAPPDTPPEQLEAGLRTRVTPYVLLVDGVEEAGAPGDVTEPERVARYLNGLAARVGQMRVVATWHPAGQDDLHSHDDIDLDGSTEDDRDALLQLATRLLLEPDGPGSAGGCSPRHAREAAPGVVRRSDGNHLVLRLEIQRLTASSAATVSPVPSDSASESPLTVPEAFRRALAARCSDPVVNALLTGLAFAHGTGLPWAGGLWPDTVSRMFGMTLTDGHVRDALDSAAPFVAESLDSAGRSVYRLHHEACAQVLREDAAKIDGADRMLRALEEERVAREAHARKEPGRSTDPYLTEHLPRHRSERPGRTTPRSPAVPGPGTPDIAREEHLADLHVWIRRLLADGVEIPPHLRELVHTTILITTLRTPRIESLQDEQGHKSITVRAASGESLHVTEF
ncbi:ATP-binding protein [Streptomyces sp. MBT49]|uniref:ATP-binding protein n=1 Tax=Streptomyces sp. MBT49 TaxID=1488380 RepID=UPI00190C8279|nr:ATP-binding protein [Streptomyces sp. MBT49]MBK3624045.1 ATP-binding protein [Streptomyces sp. MBT49]